LRLVPIAGNDDPSIREGLLLADLVIIPLCGVELREDDLSTSISFG
jgi:hypothetical protein